MISLPDISIWNVSNIKSIDNLFQTDSFTNNISNYLSDKNIQDSINISSMNSNSNNNNKSNNITRTNKDFKNFDNIYENGQDDSKYNNDNYYDNFYNDY